MKTPEEIKRGLQEAPHVKYIADDPSSADGRDVRYGVVIGYVLREEIIALIERLAQAGSKPAAAVSECWSTAHNIPHGKRYEMCQAVHAEANAIINATV